MAKYTGENMAIWFAGIDISGQARNLEVKQSADEVDVTTYGSVDKEFIVGMIERDATLEVLDDNTASTVRTATRAGSSGTLIWFPKGSTAGYPKFTVGTAVIKEQSLSYPYDDAVSMSVSMRLSGAVTEGTA